MVPPVRLILKMDLFALDDRITDKCPVVQIFPFHVNCGDLMIFVSGVVVESPVGVAAGGVDGDFVLVFAQTHAAPGLGHGAKNVEKLADAFGL